MKPSASALRPGGLPLGLLPSAWHHWRAVGLMLLTVACFATLDTLSKVGIGFAPVTQVLWMRYAVQTVVMTVWWAVWLRPVLGPRFFRTRHPRIHLVRALLLSACSALTFMGVRYLPVGEFTAVAFISPMIAMMLSGWLLKDHVSRAQWVVAGVSFAGAMIVMRPGAGVFGWAVLFPLAMASGNALYQLITRHLASTDEHPVFSQWIGGCIGTALVSVPLLWPGTWTFHLDAAQWAILVGVGLLGTLGHLFFMQAVALESAAALAPYTYVQIGFAMLGGWWAFGHTPDGWALLGMLVIALSGVASAAMRARRLRAPATPTP